MDFNDGCSFLESFSDWRFIKSVNEFILSEKQLLGSSDEVRAHEQRYNIYSAAFNKIIDFATTYKPVLTAIKKEYDDFIAALQHSQRKFQAAQTNLQAIFTRPTSLIYYQRRTAQLQDWIAVIKKNSADLQAELPKLQDCDREPVLKQQDDQILVEIPGLSLSESLNPAALTKHLETMKQKRADLIKKRDQLVCKTDLNIKMPSTLDQREKLTLENIKLQLRYKRLTCLNEAINLWETSEDHLPLLEFLSSKLEQVLEIKVCDDDHFNIEESQDEHPAEDHGSQPAADFNKRFAKPRKTGNYEAAAFYAAKSRDGQLINKETIEQFKSITVYEGEIPPVLLFFQAIMLSAQPGKSLPGMELSLEGVSLALQHGCIELVTFWVTQHRLTFSEELGDILCSHGKEDPCVADTCLALAFIVYSACGVHSKTALSMCKRGLVNAALEFIYLNKDFTLGCPSLALLQDLTQQCGNRVALLSVGFICHSLLSSDLEALVFQLLEKLYADNQGTLQKTILDDNMGSMESWSQIAMRCEYTDRPHLAKDIISTLLSQPGALLLSSDAESAKLMEHVFL